MYEARWLCHPKPWRRMVRPAGFEPTTPWFEAKCSIQLSYGRIQGVTNCSLRIMNLYIRCFIRNRFYLIVRAFFWKQVQHSIETILKGIIYHPMKSVQ